MDAPQGSLPRYFRYVHASDCFPSHMICGLSRFSLRYALNLLSQYLWIQYVQSSLVATSTFFGCAVATTHIVHGNNALGTSGSLDWTLGDNQGRHFLGTIVSLGILWFAYTCSAIKNGTSGNSSKLVSRKIHSCASLVPNTLQSTLRYLASFLTSLAFAFSLRLGNMVDPNKVLAFLALPLSPAFDLTLAFVAGSALSLATLLYRCTRVEQPKLGGIWNIPTSTKIDWRLILGSVIFGIGWGIAGLCRTLIVDLGNTITNFYFSWSCSSQLRTFFVCWYWFRGVCDLAFVHGFRWFACRVMRPSQVAGC